MGVDVQRSFLFILAALLILGGENSLARGKSKARAFSFFDDGGKHGQAACDGEGKIPGRLKRRKDFANQKTYKGSEELKFDAHPETTSMAWKHYFTSQSACNEILARQPKPAK